MRLLLHKDSLPLVVAQPCKVAVIGPVEEFAALCWTLAGKKIALVIAIKMNLEGLAGSVVALQKFVGDIGFARRREQRRRPILGREQIVDLSSRRYHAGPLYNR